MSVAYISEQLVKDDEPAFGAYAPSSLQSAIMAFARVPPFHRGKLRRPMANLVRALARDGVVDVTTRDGVSFRLRPSANLIEDGILVHPAYNRIEIEFLLEGTPPGGVFVDLGANMGLYTLPLARKAGPGGCVLAIDANADIVKALRFNIEASGLTNVQIACVAVGDAEGKVSLHISKDDLAIVDVADDPEGEIRMLPLARIVDEAGISSIDTMKADIEGFEDRAILPMLDERPDLHPRRISIEHLGRKIWRSDCFAAFERHGYRFVGATRGNSMFEKIAQRAGV